MGYWMNSGEGNQHVSSCRCHTTLGRQIIVKENDITTSLQIQKHAKKELKRKIVTGDPKENKTHMVSDILALQISDGEDTGRKPCNKMYKKEPDHTGP